MRRLKSLDVAPPDFYVYTDPDTGWLCEGRDYYSWVSKERDHRNANNLPVPNNLGELMQQQLCKRLPPDLCTYDPSDPEWVDVRLTWDDVYGAVKTYREWKAQGKPFVPNEEAERRAKICANCYLNVHVAGCGGLCNEIVRLVTETKGDKKTSVDGQLKNCGACKCVNSAQIWFPIDVLLANDSPDKQPKYAENCWKKVDGKNFVV